MKVASSIEEFSALLESGPSMSMIMRVRKFSESENK